MHKNEPNKNKSEKEMRIDENIKCNGVDGANSMWMNKTADFQQHQKVIL